MADKANSVSVKPATATDDYLVMVLRPGNLRPLFLTDVSGVYTAAIDTARRWRGRGDERAAHAAAKATAANLQDRGWCVLVVYDFGSLSEAARVVHGSGAETFVEFDSADLDDSRPETLARLYRMCGVRS